MPDSPTRGAWQGALSQDHFSSEVVDQLHSTCAIFAVLAQQDAKREQKGLGAQHISLGSGDLIRRPMLYQGVSQKGSIAPSASSTTNISLTLVKPWKYALIDWALYYTVLPWDIDMYLRGGPDAQNKLVDQFRDLSALDMTEQLVDGLLSPGTGTDMDGMQKHTSKTATKGGIDSSAAANYFMRGQVETVAEGSFSKNILRKWIKLATIGKVTEGGTTYYSKASNKPKLGIVDHDTFEKMDEWVELKQAIHLPEGHEYAKIGGEFDAGIMMNGVVFVPDVAMDRLRDTNASKGELFILNPKDLEIIFHKDFAFQVITTPDKYVKGGQGPALPEIDYPTVLWAKYMKVITIINTWCKRPRNMLYGKLT